MPIIDFRYRPSTQETMDSVLKSPVYADYIKRTDFKSRPVKSVNACADELRSLDIVKAVIAGRDIESTFAIASTNKELLAYVQEEPDLFVAFYGFDPGKGMESIRAFRNAIEKDAMQGASIDSGMAKTAISDARYYPLYAMCCEFNVPVIMTAGLSPFMKGVCLEHMNPMHIDKVATDFPELKILMSHGGYPFVTEAIGTVMRHANVYLDFSTCESKPLGDLYIKSANEYITDKVLFSSANPFVEVAAALTKYKALPLTEECKLKLFYENGLRFLSRD